MGGWGLTNPPDNNSMSKKTIKQKCSADKEEIPAVEGMYIYRINPFSAGTDFWRQILTSIDVRI